MSVRAPPFVIHSSLSVFLNVAQAHISHKALPARKKSVNHHHTKLFYNLENQESSKGDTHKMSQAYTRVPVTPAEIDSLARDIAQNLQQARQEVEHYLTVNVIPNGFRQSEVYKNYTKAPTGNQLVKKIQHKQLKKQGLKKESYQEFRFEHLEDTARTHKLPPHTNREKYGKKFLKNMVEAGLILEKDQASLLPTLAEPSLERTLPQGLVTVTGALTNYYLYPLLDDKGSLIENPISGFDILHKYCTQENIGKFTEFLLACQEFAFQFGTTGGGAAIELYFNRIYPVFIKQYEEKSIELSQQCSSALTALHHELTGWNAGDWQAAVPIRVNEARQHSYGVSSRDVKKSEVYWC